MRHCFASGVTSGSGQTSVGVSREVPKGNSVPDKWFQDNKVKNSVKFIVKGRSNVPKFCITTHTAMYDDQGATIGTQRHSVRRSRLQNTFINIDISGRLSSQRSSLIPAVNNDIVMAKSYVEFSEAFHICANDYSSVCPFGSRPLKGPSANDSRIAYNERQGSIPESVRCYTTDSSLGIVPFVFGSSIFSSCGSWTHEISYSEW
ncbi:hypothetical protein E4U39_004317 [Claviceps sp. Clav50 group G5]|nr:hypothetical protein E4U39_004317 [Claviceps sp. Clav50 group G5]